MRKYLLLLVALVGYPQAVHAQTTGAEDGESITVLATGLPVRLADAAAPVTIIDAEEIAQVQGPDLARVFERLPGVSLSRNGGLGSFTGLALRGAASDRLLVLIDGIRAADVAAPGAGFDFGNLGAGGIETIELLRGPNSVVWGGDALAGVLNVTSRVPDGIAGAAEYGGDETLFATLGGGLRGEGHEVGLTASFIDSAGLSAAASGSEPDGFTQWQLAGRARAQVSGGFSLLAAGRYASGDLEIDGFPPPDFALADTAERQETREASGRMGMRYESAALLLEAGVALSDTERDYFDPALGEAPYFSTDGRSVRAELRGRSRLFHPDVALSFGASRDWTRMDDGGSPREAEIDGAYALLGWHGERAVLTAGIRRDDHPLFGGEWSLAANGALRLGGSWRIRAGYGEGFKPPSLFQSQSGLFGNPSLAPERSRAFDIGIERGTRQGELHLALSAFRRDSEDLIAYTCCSAEHPFGTYENIGAARAEGFEFEAGYRLGERLRARGLWSYVETEDRTPGGLNEGRELARRPRHTATLSLDWDGDGFALGADLRIAGRAFDDAANTVRLDPYAVLSLRGSLPLSARFEMFGRVENVWDEDYETVAGYGTRGRAAFIGARARL